MEERAGIDVAAPPSGDGCVECDATGGWWVHLRRCTQCGHVGCCNDSISKHATAHWRETGHPIIRTYEPEESWFWDYEAEQYFVGPALTPPLAHPADQAVPGPADRLPPGTPRLR